MQNLKTTNSRLTAALQESMTNVDQWHRQLANYKEENEKLKRKVIQLKMLKCKFPAIYSALLYTTE